MNSQLIFSQNSKMGPTILCFSSACPSEHPDCFHQLIQNTCASSTHPVKRLSALCALQDLERTLWILVKGKVAQLDRNKVPVLFWVSLIWVSSTPGLKTPLLKSQKPQLSLNSNFERVGNIQLLKNAFRKALFPKEHWPRNEY